jgi:pentatricopeptide repeat protein
MEGDKKFQYLRTTQFKPEIGGNEPILKPSAKALNRIGDQDFCSQQNVPRHKSKAPQKNLFQLKFYASKLNSLGKSKKEKDAVNLYNEMIERGIAPNVVIYTILIDMYRKLNNPGKALYVYDLMISRGVAPNVATFNTLINMFAKDKDEKNALTWFDVVSSHALLPNTQSYSIIIGTTGLFPFFLFPFRFCFYCFSHADMYGKMGRPDDAIWWFNDMTRCGLVPSIVTFAAMIDMYSKLRLDSQALYWFNVMKTYGIVPNVYAMLFCSFFCFLVFVFCLICILFNLAECVGTYSLLSSTCMESYKILKK